MTIPEIKDLLEVDTEAFNAVRKSCGLTGVKNFNEGHVTLMKNYLEKEKGMLEEKESTETIEFYPTEEKMNKFKLAPAPIEEKQIFLADTREVKSKIKSIEEGDLIKLLSKAYDVGLEHGKNSIEVSSYEQVENILDVLIENKKVS